MVVALGLNLQPCDVRQSSCAPTALSPSSPQPWPCRTVGNGLVRLLHSTLKPQFRARRWAGQIQDGAKDRVSTRDEHEARRHGHSVARGPFGIRAQWFYTQILMKHPRRHLHSPSPLPVHSSPYSFAWSRRVCGGLLCAGGGLPGGQRAQQPKQSQRHSSLPTGQRDLFTHPSQMAFPSTPGAV